MLRNYIILICFIYSLSFNYVSCASENSDNLTDFITKKVQGFLVKNLDNGQSFEFELDYNRGFTIDKIANKQYNIIDVVVDKYNVYDKSFVAKIVYDDGKYDIVEGRYNTVVSMPVVANYLPSGHIIKRSDVLTKKIHTDKIPQGAILSLNDIIGMQVRNNMNLGSIFTANILMRPIIVNINSKVNITYYNNAITLRTIGTALSSGAVGDVIKVRNEDSGAVLLGEIIDKNTVKVGD